MKQPEEKLLFAKALDQADFCLQKHKATFSDFMDISKCIRLQEILCRIPELNFQIYGCLDDAERNLFGFVPDYMEITEEMFPIKVLKIGIAPKFAQKDLSHRDYLGSILGLGIDRSKIGDIVLTENGAICIAKEDIAEYISSQLVKVSHTPVKVEILSELPENMVSKKIEQYRFTVSSLRIDVILSTVFHISRAKVQEFIRGEKASRNWSVISSVSATVEEGDILSLRGYGRIRLEEIQGKTKKDRISILVGKYV